ncbi:uncharacterized protein H6S33_011463 [Morchella sextelata]|uniref:uncharacterized protein n=1 Tax=Morchella sextelata TaxID=1174677 RepID=UPI001D03CF31|nr:uncharacterized protein H6S33_011463 [Morchella sextelata]KAH0611036.1 hypothetical protein H6S33_011463 [Morchella sextelata]
MPPLSPRPPSYRPIPPPRDHHHTNDDGDDDDQNPPAYPTRLSILPPPYVRGPQPPLPPTPPPAPDSADKDLPSLPAQWGVRLIPNGVLPASPEDPPSPLSTAFPIHERPLPPLPSEPASTYPVSGALRRAISDMRPLPPLPGSERPLPPPPPSRGGGDVDMTPLLPPLPGARERVPGMVGQMQRGPAGRKRSWQGELGRVGVGLGCGFGTGGRGKGRRAVSGGC